MGRRSVKMLREAANRFNALPACITSNQQLFFLVNHNIGVDYIMIHQKNNCLDWSDTSWLKA